MSTRSPLPRLLAAALVAVLVLAACGGDDSDGGASDSDQTTESAGGGGGESGGESGDDPIAAAIRAQADALGIEDAVVDGDDLTLVMPAGTDDAAIAAACAFGQRLKPDGTVSTQIDGETTPCP